MLKRFKKTSEDIGDESTNKLMNKGIYRLEEKGKKRLRTKPRSFWSAVKSISLLSLFLWWLPAVGQIIAGYVGGRRAPSPLKSVLAAMIPVSIIFAIMYAHDNGILTAQISALYSLPSSIASGLASTIPFTTPYITFVSHYMAALVDLLNSTVALWLNGFLVTIVFAYIGGLSAQLDNNKLEFRKKFSMLLPQSLKRRPHMAYASVRPGNWYEKNDLRLEELARIGGQIDDSEEGSLSKRKKRYRKLKAEMESDDEEDADEEDVDEEPRYSKKALNERLVKRALRHYEHPKKRGVRRRA